jgi:hypothetical protein
MSNKLSQETPYERLDSTILPSSSTLDSWKPVSVPTTNPLTHAELGIPERFQILCHTVEVIIDETDDVGRFGDSDFATNRIRLFVSGSNRDVILHTYWHEVTHFLLHYAGHSELSDDEVLVDVLGGLLAQVLASSSAIYSNKSTIAPAGK